jgi:hypothetical protein
MMESRRRQTRRIGRRAVAEAIADAAAVEHYRAYQAALTQKTLDRLWAEVQSYTTDPKGWLN